MPEIEPGKMPEIELSSLPRLHTPSELASAASSPPTTRRSSFTGSQAALSTGLNESMLPPVDRGLQANLFVLGGLLIECFTWGWSVRASSVIDLTVQLSFGVLQEYFTAKGGPFEGQYVAVSAVGTVALALQYSDILGTILLNRRYPWLLRPVAYGALVVMFASLVLASFATQVWQLVLTLGVLFGISSGVFSGPVTIGLAQWFQAKRGQAFGVISGGTGVAGAALPLILGWTLKTMGWQWTLRGYAAIATLVIGLSLRFLLKPRLPVPSRSRPIPRQPLRLGFLRRPLYFLILLVLFTQSLAFLPVSIYLPIYATSEGESAFTGQLCLSFFNAASTVGAVGIGAIADKVSYLAAMFISAFLSSIFSFLLFGFTSDLAMLISFSIIFGLVAGGFSSAFIVAASDLIKDDRDQMTLAFASWYLFKGLAGVVGPIIAGLLRHETTTRSFYGGYGFAPVVFFVGSVMLATSCIVLLSAFVRAKSKTS